MSSSFSSSSPSTTDVQFQFKNLRQLFAPKTAEPKTAVYNTANDIQKSFGQKLQTFLSNGSTKNPAIIKPKPAQKVLSNHASEPAHNKPLSENTVAADAPSEAPLPVRYPPERYTSKKDFSKEDASENDVSGHAVDLPVNGFAQAIIEDPGEDPISVASVAAFASEAGLDITSTLNGLEQTQRLQAATNAAQIFVSTSAVTANNPESLQALATQGIPVDTLVANNPLAETLNIQSVQVTLLQPEASEQAIQPASQTALPANQAAVLATSAAITAEAQPLTPVQSAETDSDQQQGVSHPEATVLADSAKDFSIENTDTALSSTTAVKAGYKPGDKRAEDSVAAQSDDELSGGDTVSSIPNASGNASDKPLGLNPVQNGLAGNAVSQTHVRHLPNGIQPVLNQVRTPVADAVDSVTQSPAGTSKELTLQLKPENLGQLRISLMSTGNQHVNIRLVAENPETQHLLQSHIHQLQKTLESQGVQIDRLTVIVNQHEAGLQTFRSENHAQQQHNASDNANENFWQQQQQQLFGEQNSNHANAQQQQARQFFEAMGGGGSKSGAFVTPSGVQHAADGLSTQEPHRQHSAHENGQLSLFA